MLAWAFEVLQQRLGHEFQVNSSWMLSAGPAPVGDCSGGFCYPADLDVALIRGEGAANAHLVAVKCALSAHCDTYGGVPADGVDLRKDVFPSTTKDSDTSRQAGTPLLDYQPVCRRTGGCSEENAPRVGLEILRALAEGLLFVRRLRVSSLLSVGF